MVAQLANDSMRVQIEMSADEYRELRELAAANRTPDKPESVTEELHFLPDYGALLASAALRECQAAGYASFEELEAAAKADPILTEADSKRLWERIVGTLRAAGLWVEDKSSEVKRQYAAGGASGQRLTERPE